MNLEIIASYIHLYGYLVIFFCLFFGIIGIPAPEESLLFFIGALSVHHQLSLGLAVLFSVLGAFVGMLTAYICGKLLGLPFIKKYGKYIKITSDRLDKTGNNYTKNIRKTIVLGFYLPGFRQLSPYFAGIAKIPFKRFFLLSLLGTLLWAVPFIMAGYYTGAVFHLNAAYVPYLGLAFSTLFLSYILISFIKKRLKK